MNCILDFRRYLQRDPKNWDSKFARIKVGEYALSIQASDFHYSKPREKGLGPYDYTEFEVAIFKNGEWLAFKKEDDNPLKHGPWMKHIEKIGENPVFPYVPVRHVQALYERVVRVSYPGPHSMKELEDRFTDILDELEDKLYGIELVLRLIDIEMRLTT